MAEIKQRILRKFLSNHYCYSSLLHLTVYKHLPACAEITGEDIATRLVCGLADFPITNLNEL